jgi:hypothetical protein
VFPINSRTWKASVWGVGRARSRHGSDNCEDVGSVSYFPHLYSQDGSESELVISTRLSNPEPAGTSRRPPSTRPANSIVTVSEPLAIIVAAHR